MERDLVFKVLEVAAFALQKAIVYLGVASSFCIKSIKGRGVSRVWVVASEEISGIQKGLAEYLNNSVSINLQRMPTFYQYRYTHQIPKKISRSPLLAGIYRHLIGPFWLGFYSSFAEGVVYLGISSFLLTGRDQRKFEFNFLYKRNVKIICYLLGTDIRSPLKMREQELRDREENYGTYQKYTSPNFCTTEYEISKQKLAKVIDEYAAAIFNASYDQASYLNRPTHPSFTFVHDDIFKFQEEKFQNLKEIRVIHAPSNPIIKGTQVIRTIVRQLQNEGYAIHYVELNQKPNIEVLEELQKSHISINELYSFTPGIFTLESLASGCAVLTRSDSNYEPGLPPGANSAWVVTPSYELYKNLKYFCDNPEQIQVQAKLGYEWANSHAKLSIVGRKIRRIIEDSEPPRI